MSRAGAAACAAVLARGLCRSSLAAPQPAGGIAPFHAITTLDSQTLKNAPAVTKLGPAAVSLKTAASVVVNVAVAADPAQSLPAFAQSSRSSQRGNAVVSKTYLGIRSLPQKSGETTPAGQPVPPAPDIAQRYDFACTADQGQSWATMSETGRPFVFPRVAGGSQATASASWTATVDLTGSGQREVYAEFALPPVKVTGRQEAPHLALWQAWIGERICPRPCSWSSPSIERSPMPKEQKGPDGSGRGQERSVLGHEACQLFLTGHGAVFANEPGQALEVEFVTRRREGD